MSFYKVDPTSGELLSGPTVRNASYLLTEENKDTQPLPVDGWYWFSSDLDATITLQPLKALQLLQETLTQQDESPP